MPAGEFFRYGIAFAQNDETGVQKALNSLRGKPIEPIILVIQAQGQCSKGKVSAAEQTFSRATELARHLGLKEFAANSRLALATCEVEIGNTHAARKAVS